ncbi:MAG: ATP-dependent helicase [Lachnospiraceae bacterium]|nr:ATP-dependent helicase [Lachnospiraceae bacterium]
MSGSPSRTQREAIRFFQGPCLVLAGPGSGKTFVITERIHYLITQRGVAPDTILALSYSRASADELKTRCRRRFGEACEGVCFGTFHSVFYQFLKEQSKGPLSLLTGQERHAFFTERAVQLRKGLMEESLPPCFQYLPDEERALALASAVALMKSAVPGQAGDMLERQYPGAAGDRFFLDTASAYEAYLKKTGRIDYEDMLLRSYILMRDDAAAAGRMRGRFRFLLVDEFQDMNPLQLSLMKCLLSEEKNLFVVGDDDQAIYAFRGAVPSIVQLFEKDFPDCRKVCLSINYRCAPGILRASTAVVRKNQNRMEKHLKAASPFALRCFFVEAYSDRRSQFLAQREKIRRFLLHGETCAVILRSHFQADLLLRVFADAPDPRAEYMICRLLRLALPMFFPCISGDSHETERQQLRILGKRCGIRDDLLLSAAKKHRERTIPMAIREILLLSRAGEILCRDRETAERVDKLLELLMRDAKAAASPIVFCEFLERQAAAILQPPAKEELPDPFCREQFVVCTMHGAKGLEFAHVFVPDLNEGVLPTRRAVSADSLEEERRLLYVAMTRAIKTLELSYVTGSDLMRPSPCRFLSPFLADRA